MDFRSSASPEGMERTCVKIASFIVHESSAMSWGEASRQDFQHKCLSWLRTDEAVQRLRSSSKDGWIVVGEFKKMLLHYDRMALWSEQTLPLGLSKKLLYTRNKLALLRWFAHPPQPEEQMLFLDPTQVQGFPPLDMPKKVEEGDGPSSSSSSLTSIAPKYFIFPVLVCVNSCEFDREVRNSCSSPQLTPTCRLAAEGPEDQSFQDRLQGHLQHLPAAGRAEPSVLPPNGHRAEQRWPLLPLPPLH